MLDGTILKGIKVEFRPICSLKNVNEFRGLPYAEIAKSRFISPRDPGRSHTKVRHAINHKTVCPQKTLAEYLNTKNELPLAIREKYFRIGKYIGDQSEECLYLNMFVPYKGKLMNDKWMS
jgi:carboxylesterase type B